MLPSLVNKGSCKSATKSNDINNVTETRDGSKIGEAEDIDIVTDLDHKGTKYTRDGSKIGEAEDIDIVTDLDHKGTKYTRDGSKIGEAEDIGIVTDTQGWNVS